MSISLKIAAQSELNVAISPLAELGAALHVLDSPGHHRELADWAATAGERMSARLRTDVADLAPLWRAFRCRIFYPRRTPRPASDFDQELLDLEAVPADLFAAYCAHAIVGGGPFSAVREISKDHESQRLFLSHSRARGSHGLALAQEMLRDIEGFRTHLIGVFDAFYRQVFEPEWQRLLPGLADEAWRARRLFRERGAVELLSELNPTAKWPSPSLMVLDKIGDSYLDVSHEPLTVIPSALGAPHLILKDELPSGAVLHYPMPAKGAPAEPADSIENLQRQLLALSDPIRLRLCRDLARDMRSTRHLADRWDLPESVGSRHLKALKKAGLVRVERQGNFVLYRLDIERVERLGTALMNLILV
ncbi:MAG: DUF5937 family protein [Renibacterium salmoninarum]|nr:DUF5937 family protein [Renibacterium salmoninarum]